MRASAVICLLLVTLAACGGGGDQGRIMVTLSLEGLPDLGPQGGWYEGFAIVSGFPRSTGAFRIDSLYDPPLVRDPRRQRTYGTVLSARFGPSNTDLGELFPFIQEASEFFITIEPEGDRNLAPSGNVVLRGPFIGNSAVMTTRPAFLADPNGPGVADLQVQATLLSATQVGAPPERGIWFVGAPPPGAIPGLVGLPELFGAWRYEGWVRSGTVTLSTGTFTVGDTPDQDAQVAPTRGADSIGLPFPGQDFVTPATLDSAVATDLVSSGNWRVEITVEPVPDNSPGPFVMTILEAAIPVDAVDPLTGVAARNIQLLSTVATLPWVEAQVTLAGLHCNAANLSALGPPTAGVYGLYVTIAGSLELVNTFILDGVLVVSPDLMTTYGFINDFTFDATNSDPGLIAALDQATEAFLGQLPQGGPQPAVEPKIFLAGAFATNPGTGFSTALMAVDNVIPDLDFSAGIFTCRTPTNDDGIRPPDDQYGVWFRALSGLFSSLDVPILPPAWKYEGWVVNTSNGERLSTGTFRNPDGPDDDSMTWPGRGPDNTGFQFAGQDFVETVPGVMVPPLDLRTGWEVLLSIEPQPDNGPGPFLIIAQGPTAPTALTPFAVPNLITAGLVIEPAGIASYEEGYN